MLIVVVVVEQESLRLGVVLRVWVFFAFGCSSCGSSCVSASVCVLGFPYMGSRGVMQFCTNADAGRSCI